MARALIKHWSALHWRGADGWFQEFEYMCSHEGSEWQSFATVQLGDNDNPSQIRTALAAKMREVAINKLGVTVEAGQVIFPDGSRA